MKQLRTAAAAIAVVLLAGSAMLAQQPSSSIAGKWTMTTQMQGGNGFVSTLDLKLDGKKVTGTVESQYGTSPLTGEFADNTLTFSMTFNGQQGPMQIPYTATLKDGKLTGTLSAGQMEIPWTAERIKDPAQDAKPAAKVIAIAGNWTMALELPAIGSASPSLDLKQDGEKITGTYTGRYGASAIEGTLKDRAIEFTTTVNAEGTPAKMSFWGEVSLDGQTMTKGTAEVEGLGDATWTATKNKS